MLIGITGQIGAGKSTAARILAAHGAHVIDADRIGREVVDDSAPLRRRLARRFGASILDSGGRVKRRALARLAFASETSHTALNSLVHPYLLKELRRRAKAAVRVHALVVIDAALLLDWEMDRELDCILVIHASQSLRLARMTGRGMSRADALARQRAQLPYREFRKRADRLILNNGTIHQLETRLVAFLRRNRPAVG
ncbi:MAG TPA: dephospho-CoA kinase [Acidobacteriota bacterium]|nr:dephospho-CoA kinase [Acidobacteriota bacterium]